MIWGYSLGVWFGRMIRRDLGLPFGGMNWGMTYGVTAIGAGEIASRCFYSKYKKVRRIRWRCGTPVELRKQANIYRDSRAATIGLTALGNFNV